VAHNLLFSYFRGIHWDRIENLDLNANADNPTSPLTGPTSQQVFLALSYLKKKQARILEAFHFDGKSMKDIGRDLGISERAVEGRLRRARQALKFRLAKGIK
jgi:RNA polymerase sigma-70 factor (ECF subfamily)